MYDITLTGNMLVTNTAGKRKSCRCDLHLTRTNERHQCVVSVDIRTTLGQAIQYTKSEELWVINELMKRGHTGLKECRITIDEQQS